MDLIKDFWALVAAIVGALFWLARLESRVNTTSMEVTRLERQLENDRSEARANRAEQNEILREMQRDIKLLLGRGQQVHWNDPSQPLR